MQLPSTLELAAAEAGAAFGDARVYLERYVASGRHVEVQVLGDGNGGVIHLGERDCSVQRRYQKLVEETPAPGLSGIARRAGRGRVRFAQRLSYRGAGTVEFLVDKERDEFYFLEMNARIQVEHPVTEAVTGVDLVAEQIAIAGGAACACAKRTFTFRAVPSSAGSMPRIRPTTFAPVRAPSPRCLAGAGGIRVDTHIASGSCVPPFYDSLLAKIIAHAPDRDGAVRRLRQALAATHLAGVQRTWPSRQRCWRIRSSRPVDSIPGSSPGSWSAQHE